MRESRSSGSVQGAMSNHGSYCDSVIVLLYVDCLLWLTERAATREARIDQRIHPLRASVEFWLIFFQVHRTAWFE